MSQVTRERSLLHLRHPSRNGYGCSCFWRISGQPVPLRYNCCLLLCRLPLIGRLVSAPFTYSLIQSWSKLPFNQTNLLGELLVVSNSCKYHYNSFIPSLQITSTTTVSHNLRFKVILYICIAHTKITAGALGRIGPLLLMTNNYDYR